VQSMSEIKKIPKFAIIIQEANHGIQF
jgi:hypothetical protein